MTNEQSPNQQSKPVSIERLDANMASGAAAAVVGGCGWRSYADAAWSLCGLPWYGADERALRRLPGRAQRLVREPVWSLAQHPSGARLRFRTDSTSLRLRITQPFCEMTNMSPVGHSGIDLYVGPPATQTYWASVRPDLAAQRAGKPYETVLAEKLPVAMRDITLYLPVYNALLDLDIGLDHAAQVLPPTPYVHQRPLVFYGTSITQSGCASRPGNGYVPILGQLLAADVVNLGFSGNGLGEPELADLVAEIDASVFVLDYEANAGLERMRDNLLPFAHTIRRAHPRTPLVILSKPFFSKIHMDAEGYAGAQRSTAFFTDVVRVLNETYPGPTRFVDGWSLIGPDTPYAYVDGVHPNDYGFALMAERLAPVLRALLAAAN